MIRAGRAAVLAALIGAISRAGAVVGPSVPDEALASHAVMLLNHDGARAGYCSAVVATRTVLLTAAHCVPGGAALKAFYRDRDGAPVLLDVSGVERHPGYRPDAIRKRERSVDLALVRLPTPLPDRFAPAALGGSGPPATAGMPYRVGGYGLAREGAAATSGTFRVAMLAARAPLSDLLLWAEDPQGRGSGACTGDSGGPIFAADGEEVLAVTVWSAGRGAAQCGALTQAVWVAPQREWIEGVLARWR